MEYLLGGLWTIIAICLFCLGFVLGKDDIKDDCDVFGKVQIEQTVYICTLETKK